jgi:hypothetical protein
MWQVLKSIFAGIARVRLDHAFCERVAKSLGRIRWSNVAESVAPLCRLYSKADAAHREYVRSLIHGDFAEQLLAFVTAKAMRLLDDGTEEDLRLALIALAIEDQKAEDFRNTIVHLAKLNHAAEKKGIDIDPHIVTVCELCSERTADVFRGFVRRDVQSRRIQAFGFDEQHGRFVWRG